MTFFQRKDAKMQRRKEMLFALAVSCLSTNSPVSSGRPFASLPLCVFALKKSDATAHPIRLRRAALIQNLGDVQHADRFLLAADQAVEVHQAGHVVGGEDFGAGLFVIVQAVESHHG